MCSPASCATCSRSGGSGSSGRWRSCSPWPWPCASTKGFPSWRSFSLLLSAPAIARLALHRFRQSPFYNDEIDFSLSENGSHARGRHSEVRHGWEAYTKARRFKDGLLLCHGPDAFHWLPDAAAADPAAIAAAQQLARARIRDYREL